MTMYRMMIVLITMIIILEIVSKLFQKKIDLKNILEDDIDRIISILDDRYLLPNYIIKTNSKTFSYTFAENKICIDNRKLIGHNLIKGIHEIAHGIDASTKITSAIFVIMPHIRFARCLMIAILLLSRIMLTIKSEPIIYMYLGLSILYVFSLIYIESRANYIVASFNNFGSDRCILSYIWISFLLQIIWSIFFLIMPLSIIKILNII